MHWNWNYPWSPDATWTVILAAGGAVLISYLVLRRQISFVSLHTLGMLTLRGTALALLIFLLLQPSVFITRTDEVPPHLAVLVDSSGSMSVKDDGESQTRIQQALALVRKSGIASTLASKAQLNYFEFTTGTSKLPPEVIKAGLEAKGTGTSLRLALSQTKAEFKGEDLAGIILLSDGKDNVGLRPEDLGQQVQTPIFAIGLGKKKKADQKTKEKDLEVVRVEHDHRVLIGHATDIKVTVRAKGVKARSVPVELRLDEKVIRRTAVALSPRHKERQVTLKLTPDSPGQYVYTVRVPADEDETNKENNQKPVLLFVTDQVSRVLYVEARPRWEFKFLSRVLSAYKNIRHTSLIRLSPERSIIQGSDPAESAVIATMKPQQIRRLKALVIGDVPRTFFSTKQLENIHKFVEEGGSVLLLGGKHSLGPYGFSETPLAKALPVDLSLKSAYKESPVGAMVTVEGKAHPIFQNVRYDWQQAPQLLSFIEVGDKKAGATVLMQSTDGNEHPLVVVQRYGRGKAAIILTDSTWRWRLGMADGTTEVNLHTVFWRQMINWLMPEQKEETHSRSVQLIADKMKYELNEPIQLTITALDARGVPATGARVVCRIFAPDGKVISKTAAYGKLPGAGQEQPEGFFTSFLSHVAGKYKVVATATNVGASLGRDQVSFVVGDTSIEMSETDPDFEVLRTLAKFSKGKFYTAENAAHLVKDIAIRPKKNHWTEKREIWNEWWVFLCFIGCVTVEWSLRKWRQLE